MKKMTILCLPDGRAQHTLKDEKFNPFPGRHRQVERMSEILFSEKHQKFYVQFLKGDAAGLPLSQQLWNEQVNGAEADGTEDEYKVPLYYASYPEAVAAEVEVINAMRLRGAIF